jgi:hypothetical protein
MQAGRYSELFFLDEATSLAAGHRPCGECRKDDYKRFKAAWFAANQAADMANSIGEIDRILHAERVTLTRDKKTFRLPLDEVPHGAMFEHDGNAYLHWHHGPLKWTAVGYERNDIALSESAPVSVLTPLPIVKLIHAGYVPQVHLSASQIVQS